MSDDKKTETKRTETKRTTTSSRTVSPQPDPIGNDNPSIEEMAGQMVLAGFRGTVNVPKQLSALLEDRHLGGVVLFGRNIRDTASARALTDAIRTHCHALLPPMIAVDQEGGRVQRFKAPFTQLPPARALGLCEDAGLDYKWGKVLAAELQQVGVNFNLAPVMDVDTNPDNPVIGDRALGDTAENVSRLGMSVALGMQQRGVGACAKHFPGHGAAKVDSHEELPVLELNARRLKKVELPPFKRAATGGMAGIMTGHLKVPNLDPELPATLSEAMIQGLIRDKWGYKGLVVSDDMEMGAIRANWEFGEAITMGLDAGIDVFLVCSDLDKAAQAVDRIVAWGKRGQSRKDRLRETYDRIVQFKKSYRLTAAPYDEAVLGQTPHKRLVEMVMEGAQKKLAARAAEAEE